MVLLPATVVALAMVVAATITTDQAMGARPLSIDHGPPIFSTTHRLIGKTKRHTIRKKETLLDIARQYNLGFNEIQDLYPQLDPWIPPDGMVIHIPSQWILPDGFYDGIVVNIAELRLYFFNRINNSVGTFPISIGEKSWPTPEGVFTIKEKTAHPSWAVPPSLMHKYDISHVPSGRDNPLGDFWLGLKDTHYGIHGTDFPWSIGRAVTRGCIRLYPEDIERFFELVQPGACVNIIYCPVKIGIRADRVYVEVHRDIYNRIGNPQQYGFFLLQRKNIVWRVDLEKYCQALDRQDGMPVDVTRSFTEGRGNK